MKKLLIIILTVVVLLAFCLVGCESRNPNDYTVEQHIVRITERAEKRYLSNNERSSLKVYPLFDENEKAVMYLIELQPSGFAIINLQEASALGRLSCNSNVSMYLETTGGGTWSPYTIDENNNQSPPDTDKIWVYDENNERIYYNNSPYFVTGNMDNKKYLLPAYAEGEGYYICAVKKDEKFINLIGGNLIDISNGDLLKRQPSLRIVTYASREWDF